MLSFAYMDDHWAELGELIAAGLVPRLTSGFNRLPRFLVHLADSPTLCCRAELLAVTKVRTNALLACAVGRMLGQDEE